MSAVFEPHRTPFLGTKSARLIKYSSPHISGGTACTRLLSRIGEGAMAGGHARQTFTGTRPGCPTADQSIGRRLLPGRRSVRHVSSGQVVRQRRNATREEDAAQSARPQATETVSSGPELEVGTPGEGQGRKDLEDAPEVLNADNVAVGEEAGGTPKAAKTVSSSAEKELETGPKMAAEAIDQGLDLYQKQDYKGALELFTKSLELPGMGAIRLAGKVKEYGCPSQGEENAALYNMACCYAQMGEVSSALECLSGLLENGYDDFSTLKTDPDLAACRGQEFNELVSKYDNPLTNISRALKSKDSGTNKPWVSW